MDQREYRNSINRAVAQENMYCSVKRKNLEGFIQALAKGADVNDRTRKQETGDNTSTFEHCLTMKGMAKFIEACLEHGAHVANFNPSSDKYPIHLAAETCDVHNLQELVKSHLLLIDQKFKGCTALFMLFEMLSGENWENVFECIKVLLEQGCDINTSGRDEKSPIAILVAGNDRWRKPILEHCFKHYYVDVDRKMSTTNNELIRDVIKKHFPDVVIPKIVTESDTASISDLETILMNDSEIEFLEACRLFRAKAKFDNVANFCMIYIIPDADFKNLLFKAVLKSKLKAITFLLEPSWRKKAFSDAKWIVKPLSWVLHTCCEFGNVKVLQWFLNSTSKAVTGQMYQDSLLSSIDDELCDKHNRTMLIQLIHNMDPAVDKNVCPFFKCMQLLLDDERLDIDNNGGFFQTTALHCAANFKIAHVQELLLSKGAKLREKNLFDQSLISAIDPKVLEKYLDSCIHSCHQEHTLRKYCLEMNLSNMLGPPKKTSKTQSDSNNVINQPWYKPECNDELMLILNLAHSSDKKHLLKHPVIYIILLLKWRRVRMFFYANLLLCTVFSALFILYMWLVYGRDDVSFFWYSFTNILLIVLIMCMGMRELLQLCLNVREYLKSVENYVEIALIFGAGYVLLLDYQNDEHTAIPALITILPALNLTLLVGSLPILSLSTHMVMLKKVSKNFIKCFLLYAIILVTFSASFYTLCRVTNSKGNVTQSDEQLKTFPEIPDPYVGENSTDIQKPLKQSLYMFNRRMRTNSDDEANKSFDRFENFPLSVLKTIVMLIGELNVSAIPLDGYIANTILVIFVFCVPIVLANLINGLAISDIAAIKTESELIGLVQRVTVIHKLETALDNPRIGRFIVSQQSCLRFWNECIVFSEMDVNPYIYSCWTDSKTSRDLQHVVWLLISKFDVETKPAEDTDIPMGTIRIDFNKYEKDENFHYIPLDIDDKTIKFILNNYTTPSGNRETV